MSSESVDHVSAEQGSTEPGHGHSPAAWTAVIIMLVAFTIGAVAFFYDAPVIVWAAAALAIVGLIVGGVMKRAGYGVGGSKYTPKGH
ncbi:DUF6704 family protein [Leifsonia sp. LS-T14]|uniref:DUF6704 family protein n=1 Tax=unclassified Leifsonia TaxID=2663824 RepID=UPI0035A6A2D9